MRLGRGRLRRVRIARSERLGGVCETDTAVAGVDTLSRERVRFSGGGRKTLRMSVPENTVSRKDREGAPFSGPGGDVCRIIAVPVHV